MLYTTKKITLPDSILEIGDYAFENCINLTSITIPDSLTYIDHLSFKGCTNLKNIIVNEQNQEYASIDGVLSDKETKTLLAYPDGKESKTYVVPDTVTRIKNGAFCGNKNIKSIKIPDSVNNIGAGAFLDCTNLSRIKLPASFIEGHLFDGCSSLKKITIPDSVGHLGVFPFKGCINLKSINMSYNTKMIKGTIPENVKVKVEPILKSV